MVNTIEVFTKNESYSATIGELPDGRIKISFFREKEEIRPTAVPKRVYKRIMSEYMETRGG